MSLLLPGKTTILELLATPAEAWVIPADAPVRVLVWLLEYLGKIVLLISPEIGVSVLTKAIPT
jgi:hypothetical protein